MSVYQEGRFLAIFDHVRGLDSFLGFRADSATKAFLKEETAFDDFPNSSPFTSIVLEYCEGDSCKIWMNGSPDQRDLFHEIVQEAKRNLQLPSSPFVNLASGRGDNTVNARFESIAPADALSAVEQLLQTIHARGQLVPTLYEEQSNFIDQNATDAQVSQIVEGLKLDIIEARHKRDLMISELNAREGKVVYGVAHNAPPEI